MDMNRLKDGIREKVNTVKMLAVFCAGLLSIGVTACDDGLDVTQAYPFTVETMPVPKELAKGETAEIRCELVREGEFDGAVYTIRYKAKRSAYNPVIFTSRSARRSGIFR